MDSVTFGITSETPSSGTGKDGITPLLKIENDYWFVSYDKGETWSDIYKMPIPACHRPIITKLRSDKYLITYRFDHANFIGKGMHGHIFMGCLCTKDDLLEKNRDNIVTRIFPIDYDRNINSNCGYSGCVQFDDEMIYVTSHIVDDNPVAQIRGYSFYENDILIDICNQK